MARATTGVPAGKADAAVSKKPQRKPASRYHHGDLRRALMDAALIVVRDEGVDAVRMNALAQQLRVSVAAPFRHFATRDALLVALAEEGAHKMVEAIDAAVARASEAIDREQARGVAYVRFAVEHTAWFRLLARPDLLAMSETLSALSASQEALMEAVLGRHAGERSPEVAQVSAGVLAAQAITYGLARMITDGLLGKVSADDAEALAREVTNVLGEGLMPRG